MIGYNSACSFFFLNHTHLSHCLMYSRRPPTFLVKNTFPAIEPTLCPYLMPIVFMADRDSAFTKFCRHHKLINLFSSHPEKGSSVQ